MYNTVPNHQIKTWANNPLLILFFFFLKRIFIARHSRISTRKLRWFDLINNAQRIPQIVFQHLIDVVSWTKSGAQWGNWLSERIIEPAGTSGQLVLDRFTMIIMMLMCVSCGTSYSIVETTSQLFLKIIFDKTRGNVINNTNW